MPRPNILFIMSDQHSQAVSGCYDHDIVQTPNIDRLASTGIRYDNAFCASPLCGPSRVSWITGTHPHTHGAVTQTTFDIDPERPTRSLLNLTYTHW